jgi:hypothetical protein
MKIDAVPAFTAPLMPLDGYKIIKAAQRYQGIPYSAHRNYLKESDGALDLAHSSMNCHGLLLFTARDLGLLPPDFNPNLLRFAPRQPFTQALRQLLETNCRQISPSRARIGDILLLWYRDIPQNAHLGGPHHVALLTRRAYRPDGFHTRFQRASLFHADSDAGCVIEEEIDALMRSRICSAWRLACLGV